jgi:hypothetical protein
MADGGVAAALPKESALKLFLLGEQWVLFLLLITSSYHIYPYPYLLSAFYFFRVIGCHNSQIES